MEIILTKGESGLSNSIAWSIQYPLSHVALRYAGIESDWMVHSTMGGVQPEWWLFFERRYKKIYRFKLNFRHSEVAIDRVVEKIGHKKYDYKSIVGFALVLLLRRAGIYLKKNPLGDNKSYMCTEVVVEFLNECNKLDPSFDFKKFDSELTDPKMILDYLRKRSDVFKEV